MALTRSTDPLVWIDCEMTGLNHETDQILSISCIITSHDLTPLDVSDTDDDSSSGGGGGSFDAVISTPSHILDSMSPWCITHHGASGLTAACLSSTTTASTAARELLTYIQRFCPTPRTAVLAGNSVHVDKLFLMREPWRPVVEWLHYRILDVSAVKEGVRRWCGDDVLAGAPRKRLTHQASEDVRESIEEARFYLRLFERIKVVD